MSIIKIIEKCRKILNKVIIPIENRIIIVNGKMYTTDKNGYLYNIVNKKTNLRLTRKDKLTMKSIRFLEKEEE